MVNLSDVAMLNATILIVKNVPVFALVTITAKDGTEQLKSCELKNMAGFKPITKDTDITFTFFKVLFDGT